MKQGWEIKKLGEVCTFQRGLTYSKDDEVEHSNNCVLRSNNIDLDTMSIVLDELKYINDDFVVSDDKKVKPNTILICMSNGSKQHIGKVAFIDKEYGYAFGGFMGLIRPNAEVSPKFIYYSCISSSYKHFLAGIGNGANITNLKFSDLQQYTLPVPPREEQERIVEELNCLSGVIEKKREQLRELDALAQSIFYTMFGDPITNEKGWEVKKLGEVASEIFAGGDKPKDFSDIQTDEYLYPIYANGEGDRGLLGYSKTYRVESKAVALGARGASIGNCRICEGKFTPVVRLITIIPSNKIDIIYLFYSVRTMSFNISGAGQAQLTTPNVINKSITIPPLSLQQEFAEKIEAIEKQKELIKKSISEVEDLFNSRMSYYFN